MIRPVFAHPETQKIKITRAMRMIEPKDDTSPITTPVKADEGDEENPMMATGVCWATLSGCCECGVRAYVSYRSFDQASTGLTEVLATGVTAAADSFGGYQSQEETDAE